MNRFWGGMLAAMFVAGAGSLVPACAHDDSTLFIYDVLAPPQISQGGVCTYTSDVTQPYLPAGVLDIGLTDTYVATYLVGNQMVPQGNPSIPKTETSYIQIQGAVVTTDDQSGNQLEQYTYLVSITIPPSSGGTPSYGPIAVATVSANVVGALKAAGSKAGALLTYVHFFGKTLGGQSVESNEFQFPVQYCTGCLVAFSAADINPMFASPNCVGTGQTPTLNTVPCIIGQDQPVDCSLCTDRAVCYPPPVPISTTTTTTDAGTTVTPIVDAGAD